MQVDTRVGQCGARGDGHFGVELLSVRDGGAARDNLRCRPPAGTSGRWATWASCSRGGARERGLDRGRVLHDERRRVRSGHHQHYLVRYLQVREKDVEGMTTLNSMLCKKNLKLN